MCLPSPYSIHLKTTQHNCARWRRHWGIENRINWVRNVTLDEDRSQVRTGAAPLIMAALRNLTISLFRLAGEPNIAADLRRHAAQSLALIGATVQQSNERGPDPFLVSSPRAVC